jgi:hypothetical protein
MCREETLLLTHTGDGLVPRFLRPAVTTRI